MTDRLFKPWADTLDEVVEDLGVGHRHKAAVRRLMEAGSRATPALRRGLRHADPAVRVGCCIVLDHFLDDAALPELIENLRHPNESVRTWALHALACDRCKEGSCRPGEDDVVPLAVTMLGADPSPKVRSQAVGLLGLTVHRRADAAQALEHARDNDPDRGIRKAAGWWAPGGVRYERTKPKSRTPR